jgi:hypothetical protein
MKNALAYYNVGVFENSKIVGLAPGINVFRTGLCCAQLNPRLIFRFE